MKKINELCATRIMGWTQKDIRLKGGEDIENLCWTDGLNYWPVGTYDPHRDMNYALMCLEKAFKASQKDLGEDFNSFGLQYIGVYKKYFATCDVETENETLEYEGEAEAAPLAMCICSLRACGVEEDEIWKALQLAS